MAEQLWNEQQFAQPIAAPAWRLWRYEAPAIVLGCSQRRLLAEIRDVADDVPVLMRGTGGGAVLTGPWMLGMSVALPPGHPLVERGLVGSYRWLGELLADLLRRAGVAEAWALSPERLRTNFAPDRVDWACFGGLSPWEVVSADGRKLVGLAQARKRHCVLLVGGVLLTAPPWVLLCRTLGRPKADATRLAQLTASCQEKLGELFDAQALERALEEALSDRFVCEGCFGSAPIRLRASSSRACRESPQLFAGVKQL